MATKSDTTRGETTAPRDLREHIERLKERGLLVTIDEPINKDTHLHPLVRWQFTGGLPDSARRAFMFTNVVGADGRKFDSPVMVGVLAASPEIYATGLGVKVEEIGDVWTRGIDNPIPPITVDNPVCQEVVITGEDLRKPGGGLSALPIPISTPGFDSAPYFTATLCVTKDPDTGVRNMGTYRAGLKANDRLGVRMATRLTGAGGYQHWLKYKERGEPMPIAIVIGSAPVVMYTGPQKLAIDEDEMAVAGGLAGCALRVCKAKTVDLEIPADCEYVVEGLIDTDVVEPEGPFGESHGYIALEEFNMSMRVTAITHRRNPIFVSVVSQVTPSESSVMKKVAYEPLYFQHLKKTLNIKGITGVVMHEPLSNLRPIIFLQFKPGSVQSEVWRGLQGASTLQAQCGKIVIAVTDDVDPRNADAVFWSMAYRSNPIDDLLVVPYRSRSHGPKTSSGSANSTLLIDATSKDLMPPLALPAKQFMEEAKGIWEKLGLPALRPQAPWHGVHLGDWDERWETFAQSAVKGEWARNGENSFQRRRPSDAVTPETPVRRVEK
ncbi:MAG: UbiD family decarboxylase [Beijerinckiaceae bacterium]|nr:UbiD family decarboxylase [Beijerinckiaceae bacterium]